MANDEQKKFKNLEMHNVEIFVQEKCKYII